ncbi:MAG: hypothetical protein ACYS19_05725, partial [Planctomycetota bacterium]
MTSSMKSNRAQRWAGRVPVRFTAGRLSHLFAIFLILACVEIVSAKEKEVSPGRTNFTAEAIHPMTRQLVSPSQGDTVAVNP